MNRAEQECSSLGLCVLRALGALVMLKMEMESVPKLIGTPVGVSTKPWAVPFV